MARRELEVPATADAPSQARAAVEGLGLPAPTAQRLLLVVSELVTNAVEHGPDAPVRIVLERDGALVRGAVSDTGTRPGDVGIRVLDERPGGYGLRFVEELCVRWGVQGAGTRVWFELPVP